MAGGHTRFGTNYVQWSDGVLVSEADAVTLASDLELYGNAYVEVIGGYGRRIAPEHLKVRTRGTGGKNDARN